MAPPSSRKKNYYFYLFIFWFKKQNDTAKGFPPFRAEYHLVPPPNFIYNRRRRRLFIQIMGMVETRERDPELRSNVIFLSISARKFFPLLVK
jgi:hypothetical protein